MYVNFSRILNKMKKAVVRNNLSFAKRTAGYFHGIPKKILLRILPIY